MRQLRPSRRLRGVTLIELMVVLSVLVVIISIGVPSFRDFTLNQRIKNAGFDMVASLTFARSEALKQNGTVTITPAGGAWAGGWTIHSLDADGNTAVIKRQSPLLGLVITGPAEVVFQRDGRTTAGSLQIDDDQGNASVSPRCISFDVTGLPKSRVGVCS